MNDNFTETSRFILPIPALKISILFIKNLSSSTPHKKNSEILKLRDFSFYLSSTFIYEPILIKKNYMNANIIKTRSLFPSLSLYIPPVLPLLLYAHREMFLNKR